VSHRSGEGREAVEAILIAGPTASGKSALALAIAERYGGVIVNADSMQVYRDLRIITARPTQEDEARAPHQLYGRVDAADNYSVGRWLRDVSAVLDEVRRARAMAILVGGTGLYFKALTEGLSEMPPVPESVRLEIRGRAEGRPAPVLHAELARADPATAAMLRPTDRQRILRALEVLAATGRSLISFQGERSAPLVDPNRALKLFLAPDRAKSRAAIDGRFDLMMAAGALDEVRALAKRRLDPALPAMRAHGVPGLIACLEGRMSLENAIVKAKADTRAYAKRQATWFRNQMPGWETVAPEAAWALASGRLDS
jgi:tRNA dimethylallyltransferase